MKRTMAVAAVGVGLATAFAAPAHAAVPEYKLVNYNSEKCLDVTDRSHTNGAKLQQYSCHRPVQPHQQFVELPIDISVWAYTIKSARSGKCLEVENNSISSGARIVQSTCDYDNNQRWQRIENADGSRTFRVLSSGLCLSVQGGSFQNNAPVIQEECTASRGRSGGRSADQAPHHRPDPAGCDEHRCPGRHGAPGSARHCTSRRPVLASPQYVDDAPGRRR